MAETHLEKCSTLLVIREMQTKLLWGFILYPSEWLRSIKQATAHAKMWSKGNIHPLLVGMQTCTVIMEISVMVSWEYRNKSTSKSIYTTLGYMPKGCFILLKRHLLNHVHCCFIHNREKLETTEMPFIRRADKNDVNLYNVVLLSCLKKKITSRYVQINGWTLGKIILNELT